MDNVREEGKLELTEALRSSTAAEGIPEGFHSDESGRVAPGGTEAASPGFALVAKKVAIQWLLEYFSAYKFTL